MQSDHLEAYGKMLKTMRLERKMTLVQLAEEAGLRVATISEIEAGKKNFEINTLIRICAALRCEITITLHPQK